MADISFGPLVLREHFSVKMSGSGKSFTAYIFSRDPAVALGVQGLPVPVLAQMTVPVTPMGRRHGAAATAAAVDEEEGDLELLTPPKRQRLGSIRAAVSGRPKGTKQQEEEEDEEEGR